MSEKRLNFRVLAVGSMGVGKSTKILKLALETKQSIIILDDVYNDVYSGFETVSMEGIKTWKGGKCILIIPGLDDFEACLQLLKIYQANAFVILEDTGRYVDMNVSKRFKAFVIDHRKHNFDLCFMFHSLAEVPPYICKHHSDLILFKTQDNWKEKLTKFPNWHKIAPMAVRVNKDKSFNYSEELSK